MNGKGKPFFAGIPTEPEVNKLTHALGSPSPGVITHDEISAIIGVDRHTSRYRTIVTQWRKKLFRESNIDTAAEIGVGIRVLTEPERVHVSIHDFRGAVRRIGATGTRISAVRTSELSENDRKAHEIGIKTITGMAIAATAQDRALRAAIKAARLLQVPTK